MKTPTFNFFGFRMTTKTEFEKIKKFAEDRAKVKIESILANSVKENHELKDKLKAYERSITSMNKEIMASRERLSSAENTLSKSLHNEAFLRQGIQDITFTNSRKSITNEELIQELTQLYRDHVKAITEQMNFLHQFISGNQSEQELRADIIKYFESIQSNNALDESDKEIQS